MLLLNISPIYLRCGALIPNSEMLEKELDYYKERFRYIKPEMNITYKSRKLILFQINYFRIQEFTQTPDYEFLEKFEVIKNLPLDEKEFKQLKRNLSNHKDSVTILSEPRNKSKIASCYYCGNITGTKEYLIFKLFQRKCIRYGFPTELSIKGIDYINNHFSNSFFSLPKLNKRKYSLKKDLYPYILTTGDEGNSVFRVDSSDSFKKIGHSTIGPATIWSLFYLACNNEDYEDPKFALKEAAEGNNNNIDLSVGDIYGGDYSGVGLSSHKIASNFSKISDRNLLENKDIGKALALFYGATYSKISAMFASKEKINKMIISGDTFDSDELMQIIQSSLGEFSSNTIKAVFCEYANFFEIIGMLVELDNDKYL